MFVGGVEGINKVITFLLSVVLRSAWSDVSLIDLDHVPEKKELGVTYFLDF